MTHTLPKATTEAVGIEFSALSRFHELMAGPTELGKAEVWRSLAKEIADEADALAATNADLVKALEPFAAVADVADEFTKFDHAVIGKIVRGTRLYAEITAGDCRRARAALARSKAKGGE